MNQSILNRIVHKSIQKKYIYGAVFYVSSGDNRIDLCSATGEIKKHSQYYIASINKIFITAIILKLYTGKRLDLQDKISRYLPEEVIQGLHIHKGKDYSHKLSIVHLLSQTSGLPCYLIDRQQNGKKAIAELERGIDQSWPIDRVIREIKNMNTHFPPGKIGRAKYIDTNHKILSLIIENITGDSIKQVLKDLFLELNLADTFVVEKGNKQDFVPIRYKSQIVSVPDFLDSTQNDIISTVRDQMVFLKAFFNGHFISKKRLVELEQWNNIFFPFKYGIGIQKFSLPRLLSPFHAVPEMIGHCGSTGSVAFYVPERDLYITGTTNQQARPNIAFQTMIKIMNTFYN